MGLREEWNGGERGGVCGWGYRKEELDDGVWREVKLVGGATVRSRMMVWREVGIVGGATGRRSGMVVWREVELVGGATGRRSGMVIGGAGQHHVRVMFADSAIFCNTFWHHLVLSVVCDRETLLVVCECRDSDQS